MFKSIVFAAITSLGLVGIASAHGAGGVSLSIGFVSPGVGTGIGNAPGRYYAPSPAYVEVPEYAPAPVYRARPRVVYAPPPAVYYAPERIVYPRYGGRYVDEREWRGHHGHWHGRDRDDDDRGWRRGDRDGRH